MRIHDGISVAALTISCDPRVTQTVNFRPTVLRSFKFFDCLLSFTSLQIPYRLSNTPKIPKSWHLSKDATKSSIHPGL